MPKFEHKYAEKYIVHGVLLYDKNNEEGRVRVLPNLPRDVVGLDILGDWMYEIKDEYDKLKKELR
jgi:hypothetical protein